MEDSTSADHADASSLEQQKQRDITELSGAIDDLLLDHGHAEAGQSKGTDALPDDRETTSGSPSFLGQSQQRMGDMEDLTIPDASSLEQQKQGDISELSGAIAEAEQSSDTALPDDRETTSGSPSFPGQSQQHMPAGDLQDPELRVSQSVGEARPARNSNEIGPYASAAGIFRTHFTEDGADFPLQGRIKNGLVLELHNYCRTECFLTDRAFVKVLIKITGVEGANEMSVAKFVSRLVDKCKEIKRNSKKGAIVDRLNDLREEEFLLLRTRATKTPDTPRKKRLRRELSSLKATSKSVKRKLAERKSLVTELEGALTRQQCIASCLEESRATEKTSQAEADKLSSSLQDLQTRYDMLVKDMEQLTAQFDPAVNELEKYKTDYEESSKALSDTEKQLQEARAKLQAQSTRNVNKRIKRRDERISSLQDEKKQLTEVVEELRDELQTAQEQLAFTRRCCDQLKLDADHKVKSTKKMYKKAWYQKKKMEDLPQPSSTYTYEDVPQLDERVAYLQQRNEELEGLIGLLEDDEVHTFEEGRYTDSVRHTIMELLAQNVSLNKVNSVIRTVLKNLAGRDVQRLPSAGTRSKLFLEANHLANIEVALAMQSNQPQESLGNCIHGDGTTKHHRKYQNFQVSLPDGTSRTMALMEMGRGDTEAVTEAFTEHLQQLAHTLSMVKDKSEDQLYKELITTVKSTMTDQGPTMPQFNQKLQAIREELLPQVVHNWKDLPDDVKSCVKEFGTFFCKMHPLVNFAEEVGKVLRAFEDISKLGKNAHTLQTSEAGVTRLIRTASKAFHHRGCDKSSVEDVFTSYLENAHNVKNHLVDYIGNRANILFEGAAALYFHQEHISEFLSMLTNKNNLLLAVEEDLNEKIFKAELRALGLFHVSVTQPLWEIVKSAENILALNEPLHQLQEKLLKWKDDASPVLSGDSPFTDLSSDLSSDGIAQKLLCPTDVESESMAIQALELISCAVLLILQRQCKDQLPGGKYWDPPPQVSEAFSNVPSTNLIGERDFAQLDMLVRQKPAARVTSLETIIMWTNNKTPEWLDSLPEGEKAEYMKMARQHSSSVLNRYRDRMKRIKAIKWKDLQKSQQKLKESQEKKMKATATLVNEVAVLGGLWTTTDSVNQHIKNLEKTNTDDFIRRAIHTQLSFLQKVMKCKGPSKEHYQLTHHQQPYSKSEMKKHLHEVILHHNLQPESDPHTLVSAIPCERSNVRYTTEEERAISFDEQKRKLISKIEEEKKKRSAQSSKMYLKKLLENPSLLVGKNIEHLFCVDQHKMWIKGTVIGISSHKPDAMKTVYMIDYEDEEETKKYNLLSDLNKNELIIDEAL